MALGAQRNCATRWRSQSGADGRRAGYRATVHAHALAKHIKIIPGDYTQEAGISAAPEILNSTMTAVFIGNDERAVGLAGAALRAGVATPNNFQSSGTTTVRRPARSRASHHRQTRCREPTPRCRQRSRTTPSMKAAPIRAKSSSPRGWSYVTPRPHQRRAKLKPARSTARRSRPKPLRRNSTPR